MGAVVPNSQLKTMDKICLKINELNIREYFIKLREDQSLFDVTLATDDGQHIQAHKVVLSAGSHFFNDTFLKSNHSNMLIYLKGISNAQLEPVMDFLYNGEAFLLQEEIKEFLNTGKELKIKGLEDVLGNINEIGVEEAKVSPDVDDTAFESSNVNKKRKIDSSNAMDVKSDVDDTFEKEQTVEEYFTDPSNNGQMEPLIEFVEKSLENNFIVEEMVKGINDIKDDTLDAISDNLKVTSTDELNVQIDQMIVKKEDVWECKKCGKTKSRKGHIIQHAETHIGGMSHVCNLCGKTFSTRPTLRTHTSSYHSRLYSCEICGRSDMNKQSFYMHKRSNHLKTILQK